MGTQEKIIWSNTNLNFDDWKADLESEYPDETEDELMRLMYEFNDDNLNCERSNLNVQLNEDILVLGSIGRWNGRSSGYTEIGDNIKNCLVTQCDYAKWYVDRYGNFKCEAIHHDGVNHYEYRVYKDNISEDRKERLKEMLYNNTASRADITRITTGLGKEIAKVYGW